MITCQVEKLADSLTQMKWLFPIHWKELAMNQDKVPLDPNYDIYLKREEAGEVVYCTARQGGDIVGYFVGFIGTALHYKSLLVCTPDIFYVHPELRKQDIGSQLFETVKTELKRRGVMNWIVGDKNHLPAGEFFERLGFKKLENFYSMWIA